MLVSEERYEVENAFQHDFDDMPEDEFDSFSTSFAVARPSIWQSIRRFFFKTASEKEDENRTRMYILNNAIETYPDAAVNYLLRGELQIELRQYEMAQTDFETALELAATQYDNERWGLGAQAIQDRARRGLQRTVR